MDPTQSQSLAQGFDLLFKALKNLSDGSMPVFSNEYGQIENDLSDPAFQNSLFNQSVKQFTIFLERVSLVLADLSVKIIFLLCFSDHRYHQQAGGEHPCLLHVPLQGA